MRQYVELFYDEECNKPLCGSDGTFTVHGNPQKHLYSVVNMVRDSYSCIHPDIKAVALVSRNPVSNDDRRIIAKVIL